MKLNGLKLNFGHKYVIKLKGCLYAATGKEGMGAAKNGTNHPV